jgi:hypothetical protein
VSIIDKGKYDPILEPNEDKFHRLVRATLGTIPVFSGAAVETFNSVVEDPFNARRTRWLCDISDAINSLGQDVDNLKSNSSKASVVLSAILQSTDIALKVGDKDIHKYLINIVMKTISESSPEEDLIIVYLSTVRHLTSSHLELLKLFLSRERYAGGSELGQHEKEFIYSLSQCDVISKSIPIERLLSDLVSYHLIHSPPKSPWSSGGTNYCTMELSPFANGFVVYIGLV